MLLECGARVHWKCCLLALTPPQAFKCSSKPDSRIFQGISWSVSRPNLLSRRAVEGVRVTSLRASAGDGGEPATALIDAVMCPSCEWRISNVGDRRRRRDEEMVPNGPASLGTEDICVQSLQSRQERSLQERAV